MNKIISSMIGASLLAAPFSILASDINLDDTYLDESRGAFEITVSKSPVKHIDVASGDMYIDEANGAYNHGLSGPSSNEVTELAVFSSTTRKSGPAIPGYIGNY